MDQDLKDKYCEAVFDERRMSGFMKGLLDCLINQNRGNEISIGTQLKDSTFQADEKWDFPNVLNRSSASPGSTFESGT